MLFIPIEPAFALALQEDITLYNKAFEKNIVIVTPSTLLATLRTIDSMWTNQKQQENAIEIARQAGDLYDKFVGFTKDMEDVGKHIKKAEDAHNDALNKLSTGKGNLINRAQNLHKLGIKSTKKLNQRLVQDEEPEVEEE